MNEIIKQIHNILGTNWSSQFNIKFHGEGIVFDIYESEIPIIFDGEEIYLDCECSNHHLTGDMLDELNQIVKVLEDNKGLLKEFLWESTD